MSQATRPVPATLPRAEGARTFPLSAVWAFVCVVLPVVASLEASISTVDVAYQVRAGDLMLKSHHLLRHDVLSFTAAGRPWTDQQWGSQIAFALAWRAGGWIALHLLRAALVGVIYLFVYLACRRAGASVRISAFLTLASFAVAVGGLAIRAQLFGMALFAASVFLLVGRRTNGRWLWVMPMLVAIWANVHGSFFLGPLLLGLGVLMDLAERHPAWRRTLAVFGASLFASLANPFGPKVWSYAWELSTNNVVTRFVSEWQPPTIRDVTGAAFFISAALVVVLLARRGKPTSWPTLLSLGVFFVIGLEAIRGVFWWALLAPALLAPILADFIASSRAASSRRPNPPPTTPGDSRGNPRVNVAIAAALILLGIAYLPWWRGHSRQAPSRALVSEAPLGVTAAVRRAARPGERIFDPQIWGSWFELSLPSNPMFVDARIEVFPLSLWGDYEDVSVGREGWQAILDRWRVGIVVTNRNQQRGLIPKIQGDPGWRRVHADREGLVFVRA
jgi:hypothetical protein